MKRSGVDMLCHTDILPLGALPLLERFLEDCADGEPAGCHLHTEECAQVREGYGVPASRGKSAHDVLLGPQKVARPIDNLFEIGI
jgi:hypothetical protein